jgi:hypothetical protein
VNVVATRQPPKRVIFIQVGILIVPMDWDVVVVIAEVVVVVLVGVVDVVSGRN